MSENLKALPDCPYYLPCGHCDILVQRNKNRFDASEQDNICSLAKPVNIPIKTDEWLKMKNSEADTLEKISITEAVTNRMKKFIGISDERGPGG